MRDKNVTSYKLEQICDFQNGFAFKSAMFHQDGIPLLRISNIVNDRVNNSDIVYVNPEDYKEDLSRYEVHKNDIVIAMSGATTGKVGINLFDEKFFLNQRVGKFIPNEQYIIKKYLYYLLLTKKNNFYSMAGGGAQPNLGTRDIKNMQLDIPSIDEQKEMVSILEDFDSICNDLTVGLPAEVTARQQQYEYYRDKLLTFKQKNNKD